MARYRSRGAFRLLMFFSPALAVFRLAMLALALVLLCTCGPRGICALPLALSLAAALFQAFLDRKLGLSNLSGRMLNAAAAAAWRFALCTAAALRFAKLRLPACVLLILSLLDFTKSMRRAKQPAL